MASRRERGLYDPDAAPGTSPFDHFIYCFVSDGDMEEGISHEVSSLAGHQELGNLIVLYDDNLISIEDDTHIAKSEDVAARYEAYGWHVQRLSWRTTDGYHENVQDLYDAFEAAKAVTDKPSFIALRTIIGWPGADQAEHGRRARLRARRGGGRGHQEDPGLRPGRELPRRGRGGQPRQGGRRARQGAARGVGAGLRRLGGGQPRAQGAVRPAGGARPPGRWAEAIPSFPADEKKGVATRRASGNVLSALAPVLPELWGGSADLAESNLTTMEGQPSFVPVEHQTKMWPGNPYGRTLHFGIREHGMGSILNGIALHGGTRPYGGTFLVFSDYMRPSVRLAALMEQPVTYVWTHDSIGLGEDGPTHQPVEHLWSLRNIMGLDVVRPADANETAAAWRTIITRTDRPAGLCLTRQNVPVFDREKYGPADGTARGAYVLADSDSGQPDVILIGTGSEVQIAVHARELLAAEGISARVVSMPCVEWFHEQDASYQEEVLPAAVRARVSVEAGITAPWKQFVGDAGESVGVDHYGASASYTKLYEEFGLTAERVAEAAKASLSRTRS